MPRFLRQGKFAHQTATAQQTATARKIAMSQNSCVRFWMSACLTLGVLFAAPAYAQYKWQNPDGSIGFGDIPPNTPVKILRGPSGEIKADSVDEGNGLPYAVKQSATRYPVVLYTGIPASGDCAPCKEGRDFLSKRGIPFIEKVVKSSEDVKALKAGVSPDGSLPVLAVGKEKSTGFETGSWSNLLDAAGYPKTSMLPAGYKQANAEPLTKARPGDTRPEKKEDSKSSEKGSEKAGSSKAPTQAAMVDPNAGSKIRF